MKYYTDINWIMVLWNCVLGTYYLDSLVIKYFESKIIILKKILNCRLCKPFWFIICEYNFFIALILGLKKDHDCDGAVNGEFLVEKGKKCCRCYEMKSRLIVPFSNKENLVEKKVHFSFISTLNCSHVWIWIENNKAFILYWIVSNML